MTMGALANRPDPVWNVHACLRFFTFVVLICDSVENRVPPASA
jgi:hypothetical protein